MSSSPPPPPLEGSSLDRMQSYLRQPLRISINDGRVFLGTFAGTDKPLNILLTNAEEYRIGMGQMLEGRFVGQILIPWKLVTKVEAQAQDSSQNQSFMYL